MAETIRDALGPVLTRWTMGGDAVPAAPAEWRDKLGNDASEAELRLLALSGQFLGTLVHTEPAGEVRTLADIPALPRPPLPDAARPFARRVLRHLREPAQRRNLFDFLDARGWTLHPGDWLPGLNEEVPEVYAAWQGWAASGACAPATEAPTADNWDMLGPAARRSAFLALRRLDAMQANMLLAEKIGGETPDMRARLLEVLAIGLSDADRPLLESLAADRSARVKTAAASLLARLGGGEDAAELARFFSVETKGLLRRARSVVPTALNTAAQRERRTVLMESVLFDAFARALGLSPAELAEAWLWERDSLADQTFAEMAASTGSDAVVGTVAEGLTSAAFLDTISLALLLPRVSRGHRRRAAVQILRTKGGTFGQALGIAGGDGGIDDAMDTAAGAALRVLLKVGEDKAAEQLAELTALGLLASRAAARQALEQLTAAGMIASDPRLDMVRLNATLEDRSELEGATE